MRKKSAFIILFIMLIISSSFVYGEQAELGEIVSTLLSVKSRGDLTSFQFSGNNFPKSHYTLPELLDELQTGRLSDGSAYGPAAKEVLTLENRNLISRENISYMAGGHLEIRDGYRLLHLSGTGYQMGYQHGSLLKDEIRNGVLPLFARPLDLEPEYRFLPEWIKKIIMLYYEYTIYRPIEENTPPEYLRELKGMADGAGLDYRTVFIGNFYSDFKMAIISGADTGFPQECSDFAAAGAATEDGKMIFGRNTDYNGQGRWMKYQTIFFYKPLQQNSYVKVSSAGMLKCNSAMNDKGIVVGGHFMSFTGSTPAGISFTIYENEIMRKTSTVEEAAHMLANTKRGGSFGLTVADSAQGKGMVFEATSTLLGIRKMNAGLLFETNNSTTPELQPVDLLVKYNICMRNSYGRFQRMSDLLNSNYGRINPQTAAVIMGDHFDIAAGVERAAGNIIGSHLNVTSVVFKPEEGLFWVGGTKKEPSCIYEYKGFNFFDEIDPGRTRADVNTLSPYQWEDQANRKGLDLFMDALITFTANPERVDSVLYKLHKASQIDTDEPAYKRIQAELYIQNLYFTRAAGLLHEALQMRQSNNEQAILHFYLGLLYDIQGRRSKALAQYQNILVMAGMYGLDPIDGINGRIIQYATDGTAKAYTFFDLDKIKVSFALTTSLD